MSKQSTPFWLVNLNIAICSIVIIGGFFEQKSWALVSLFFTVPVWIALFWNIDNFSIKLTKRSKYIGYPLIALNVILWLFITVGYDFLPNQTFYSYSFSIAQAIASVVLLALIFIYKNKLKGASKLYLIYTIIVLTVNNVIIFKNYPTSKDAYDKPQIVIEKYIHNSRGPHYNLKFNEDETYKYLLVTESEYNSVNVGDTVIFKMRAGKLGYDIFIDYDLKK